MPELRTLIEEVRSELMNGDPRRALSVCEHILDRYPKHLEAHCLSAEALRELGEAKSARERFLRVLSADPENVIAYWGLSIIFEEEGQLEAAIWGIDAALSVSPGHRELAQEFFRLTGEAPSLSRAGLARIRFRSGQYHLAVREAEAVLLEEPDRLDTRVLLAEALWRDGRSDEARRVCTAVLSDAPDCLKANLILGHSLLQASSGDKHHEEGLRLLRRTLALDPEARVAGELFDGAPLPITLQTVLVDRPSQPLDTDLATVDGTAPVSDEWRGETNHHYAEGFRLELAESPPDADGEPEDIAFGDEPVASSTETADIAPEALASDEAGTGVPAALVEAEPADAFIEPEAEPAEPPPEPEREMVPWLSEQAEKTARVPAVGAMGNDLAGPASPGADDTAVDPTLDPEWADLLTMEVSLDAESEARLNAALAEMGFDPSSGSGAESAVTASHLPLASDEGWREVFTGSNGLFAALEPSITDIPSEPAADHPSEAAPTESETETTEASLPVLEEPQTGMDESPAEVVAPSRPNSRSEPAELPTQRPRPEPLLRPAAEHAPVAGDFRARLQTARAYQEEGSLDAAVAEYVQLIRSAPDLLEEIIENLKLLVYTTPDHPAAHRALGDAYMRSGRFQEAIDQYNWILGQRRAGSMSGGADA